MIKSKWCDGPVARAINRDALQHNFRTGEILPSARTNEQEMALIRKEPAPVNIVPMEAVMGVEPRGLAT